MKKTLLKHIFFFVFILFAPITNATITNKMTALKNFAIQSKTFCGAKLNTGFKGIEYFIKNHPTKFILLRPLLTHIATKQIIPLLMMPLKTDIQNHLNLPLSALINTNQIDNPTARSLIIHAGALMEPLYKTLLKPDDLINLQLPTFDRNPHTNPHSMFTETAWDALSQENQNRLSQNVTNEELQVALKEKEVKIALFISPFEKTKDIKTISQGLTLFLEKTNTFIAILATIDSFFGACKLKNIINGKYFFSFLEKINNIIYFNHFFNLPQSIAFSTVFNASISSSNAYLKSIKNYPKSYAFMRLAINPFIALLKNGFNNRRYSIFKNKNNFEHIISLIRHKAQRDIESFDKKYVDTLNNDERLLLEELISGKNGPNIEEFYEKVKEFEEKIATAQNQGMKLLLTQNLKNYRQSNKPENLTGDLLKNLNEKLKTSKKCQFSKEDVEMLKKHRSLHNAFFEGTESAFRSYAQDARSSQNSLNNLVNEINKHNRRIEGASTPQLNSLRITNSLNNSRLKDHLKYIYDDTKRAFSDSYNGYNFRSMSLFSALNAFDTFKIISQTRGIFIPFVTC